MKNSEFSIKLGTIFRGSRSRIFEMGGAGADFLKMGGAGAEKKGRLRINASGSALNLSGSTPFQKSLPPD